MSLATFTNSDVVFNTRVLARGFSKIRLCKDRARSRRLKVSARSVNKSLDYNSISNWTLFQVDEVRKWHEFCLARMILQRVIIWRETWTLTLPSSCRRTSATINPTFSCQIIDQKSSTVSIFGAEWNTVSEIIIHIAVILLQKRNIIDHHFSPQIAISTQPHQLELWYLKTVNDGILYQGRCVSQRQ